MEKTTKSISEVIGMLIGVILIRVGGSIFLLGILKTLSESKANELIKGIFYVIIISIVAYLIFAPFVSKVFYSLCDKKEQRILRKNENYRFLRAWSIPSLVWNLTTAIKNNRW